MPTDDPRAAAIEAVARRHFRRYESEYSASHLTWRDFAEDAAEDVAAAVPHLTRDLRALAETVASEAPRKRIDDMEASDFVRAGRASVGEHVRDLLDALEGGGSDA